VLSYTLDRPVFAGGIATLENNQHFMVMLYDVSLNLDELNLQRSQ
jgi:hypothetical protein